MQTPTIFSGKNLGKLALAALVGLGVYQHLQERGTTPSSAPLFSPAQPPRSSAPVQPQTVGGPNTVAPVYRPRNGSPVQGNPASAPVYGQRANPYASSGDGDSGYAGGYDAPSVYGVTPYASSGDGQADGYGMGGGYGSGTYGGTGGASAGEGVSTLAQGNNIFTNDELWRRDEERQKAMGDLLGGTTTYKDAGGDYVQTDGVNGSAYQDPTTGDVATFDSPNAAPDAGSGYTQPLTPLGTDSGSSSSGSGGTGDITGVL